MLPDTLATVAGIRRILIKAAVLIILILALVAVSPAVYRLAKIYRYGYLAERARQKGELQTALFYAYSAYHLKPKDDKALGVIARIATETGQPSALIWLARWTELKPTDPERLLALGKLALVENQPSVAEVCLGSLKKIPGVPEVDTADLEASLLVRKGKTPEALQLLKDASSRPGAPVRLSLNYAVLLLSQPRTIDQEQGIQLLQKLAGRPELAFPALSNLIFYSFDRNNKELAKTSADQLARKPALSIDEYLLTLQVELFINGKLPDTFRRDLPGRLYGDEKKISKVIRWLLRQNQSVEADALIGDYLQKGQALKVVRPMAAFRMADRGEWNKILDTLPDPEWKDLGVVRYALLIQACRMLADPGLDGLKKTFNEALRLELRQYPQGIFEVDKLAIQWRWKKERLQIWEAVRDQDILPADSIRAELAGAQKRGDTIMLYGLAHILLERFPENQVLANNVLTYALLLDLSPEEQLQRAKELVEKNPSEKYAKTTYALALLKNGKEEEALSQYADFSKTELQKPELAAYYAMALLASGQKEKAQPYLALATKAALLPEERALLK